MALEPLTGDDPGEVAGYRLRARLGAGGMGRVYLAFTPGGRPVALKVVRPEFGGDEEFRARFRQEIQAAWQVHGLYTAQVLDAGPDAPQPWLVTAYVAGPSLAQAVRDYGPMPADTVLQLIAGVAEALQAIHAAGIVHRDLKPSNVLLAPDGPRVIDFGIARAVEGTAVTRTGMRVGSPHYMAPEQIAGRSVSPAIDVFALGSLAAFAALGRPPFGEGDEAAVMYRIRHEPPDLDGCPEPVRGLIERCLAKDPGERPSPAEIVGACRVHTAGKTVAQSWLPEVVAAGLVEHAAPPAPAPTVTQPPAHDAPTMYPPPPPPVAGLGLPLPAAGLAKTEALQAGDAPQPARQRLPRLALIGGAAAVVIAAIAMAATLLPGNGTAGNNSPGGGPGGHHPTTGPSQGTNLSVGAGKSPAASPSPTLAPHLDPCLIGTWKSVNSDVINQINGQPTEFIGQGPTATYRANGTGKTDYGKRTVFRATVNGNKWTYIITGYITWHWRIRDGEERDSHPREHGTLALFDNGVYNNGGPLRLGSGPGRYTCSGNTLQYFSNIGSETLIRVQPKPQQGS